ncbi:MAG: PIN domain-containing protein [Candidatus Thorarchaeota archaeon]
MTQNTDSLSNKIGNDEWDSFKQNHRKYRKYIDGVADSIDKSMSGHLKSCLLEYDVLLPEGSQARIELILDTSILFKQILGELKGYSSSLIEMIDSGFLMLYAPSDLENEISEKIEEKLPKGKQERAHSFAKKILGYVTITDDIDHRIIMMSNQILGRRDPKDVVFLALTFQKHAHGILTADKDFEDIENIKRWQVGSLGEIVTGLRQGSTVIWIVAKGLPAVLILLGVTVDLIVQSIIGMGKILYGVGTHLVSYAIEKARQIPPIIPLVIAIFSILAIAFSEELRQAAKQGLEQAAIWIVDNGLRIAETLQQFGGLAKFALSQLVEEAPTMVEVIGFLAYDIFNMVDQLKTLESERAELPELSPYEILMNDIERIVESLRIELRDIITNEGE